MKKLYRYIKLYLKMTYESIVQHFGLTFPVSVAVSIILILISVFILLTNNLNSFTKHTGQQVTIRMSIDTTVKDKQKQRLLHAIKQLNTVKYVTLSIGKEELENYKTGFQDDSTVFGMYEEEVNPIRDMLLIEVKNGEDIQKIVDKIGDMKGIVSAEYGRDSIGGMISVFERIQEGGMIFIISPIVTVVFLISDKVRMSIYTRKQEIAIMRLVGINDWATKFPMMLEDILIGTPGSPVPVLPTIFGYQYIYTILGDTPMSNMSVLQTVFPITLEISGVLILIGVLVGLVRSFFSTTRYLCWKR